MRKVVTPQRDIFARSIDQLADLPGLQLDERDYFRDVYDHLIRISDLIDSYRDLLGGATDVYLSTVANRQNEVMKQLAVDRHDLPAAHVRHRLLRPELRLDGHARDLCAELWKFAVFGVGSLLVSCVALLAVYFKRRGLAVATTCRARGVKRRSVS